MTRFIKIDYTGRTDGHVFDSTRAADAPSRKGHGPVVVAIGTGQLLPGLDAFLSDKQPGDYVLTLSAEQAFGKKDAKMLKLVPIKAFGKEARNLAPNLPVTIGEQRGIVKSISGGRVVIDFNHPLAGKQVDYSVTLHGDVTDETQKVEATVQAMLGVALPVQKEGDSVVLSLPKGFPAEGLIKEIERISGVVVKTKEVDMQVHGDHVHLPGESHHH